MVCQASDHWSVCAKRVQDAIRGTNDPAVALAAALEWSERYRRLYEANPQTTWTQDDQARLDRAMNKLWDEALGKYLDPAALAWALLLAKYAKTLSGMLEWTGGRAAIFIYALLAPSPIANDFTAAKPENETISRLLFTKFPPPLQRTIELRYPPYLHDAYSESTGGSTLP